MNSQGNLFRHDMRPCVRSLPSKPAWERVSTEAKFWGGKSGDKYREMRENRAYDAESEHEGFVLRFEHTVDEAEAEDTLYFAFCFPSTYADTIARLAWLDHEFWLPFARVGSDPLVPTEEAASEAAASAFRAALAAASSSGGITPSEESDARAREIAKAAATLAPIGAPSADAPVGGGGVYYHRELLTRSLDGRRIDLLTISGTNGMLDHTDEELAPLADAALPRATSEEGGTCARAFRADKPVFLLTSRVHPGETPASHVLDGALEFLLDPTDPRAAALRERFVFKLVPLINPDGVYAATTGRTTAASTSIECTCRRSHTRTPPSLRSPPSSRSSTRPAASSSTSTATRTPTSAAASSLATRCPTRPRWAAT